MRDAYDFETAVGFVIAMLGRISSIVAIDFFALSASALLFIKIAPEDRRL